MSRLSSGTPSHVDLRGFHYALEALQHKHQWELDTLQAQLGHKQREISEAHADLVQLRARFQAQTEQVLRRTQERLDPMAHRQGLAYLMQMQQSIQQGAENLTRLRAEKAKLQDQCVEQHQKLELLARHREESVHLYAADLTGRLANEADGDWLSRQHWRAGQGNPQATEVQK